MTLDLDLDPTEQRIADALGRIARAHVPEVTVPAPLVGRDPHRRWLTLAVAASLVALLVGIVAVANRPADTPVTTTPATAPPRTATPTLAPTPPPTDAPSTTVPPAPVTPDDPLAIIDPALAPSAPTTPGSIDRYLRWTDTYELQSTRAVRRSSDGTVEATVVAWLVADLPSSRHFGSTVAGRPTLRSVAEAFGTVGYFVDLVGGTLEVSTQPGVEDEVVAWIDDVLTAAAGDDPDLTAVAPPDGFEPLPRLRSTHIAKYVDGAGDVTLETMRFAEPIAVSDWIATQTFGAAVTTEGALTTVTMDGGAGYVLWQPRPDVIVSLTGDGDVTRWTDALQLSTVAEVLPAQVSTGVSVQSQPRGDDERSLDRIVLGATSIGRFAYAEQRDGPDGFCTGWAHTRFGGGVQCAATTGTGAVTGGTSGEWCGASWGIEYGSYVYAIAVDRPDASIEFVVDGASVAPTTVETGQASDGTPFTVGWIADPTATSEWRFTGTITIDGEPCASSG